MAPIEPVSAVSRRAMLGGLAGGLVAAGRTQAAAAFDNPAWPRDVRPPNRRSVVLHQGSQWQGAGRYSCVVGTIREACLRAHPAGLEMVKGRTDRHHCRTFPL